MIRQQPGSTESDQAKKRIDELRAKVGEAALQPAFSHGRRWRRKGEAAMKRGRPKAGRAKPGPANNEAPLPAPETDVSLPPPASLAPDTTTAPEPLPAPPSTSTSSGTLAPTSPLRSVRLTGAVKASFAAALACVTLTGCLGYHIGPVKPYYLRDVHTIAVPTFKNHTLVPRIEVLVTDTVIKQLQQDGTFQIASGENADATLTAEIIPHQPHPGALGARERAGHD